MEILGHFILFVLEAGAVYGMLADKSAQNIRRFAVSLPLASALLFGWAGFLTAATGCSLGTQIFLGARLFIIWRRKRDELQ